MVENRNKKDIIFVYFHELNYLFCILKFYSKPFLLKFKEWLVSITKVMFNMRDVNFGSGCCLQFVITHRLPCLQVDLNKDIFISALTLL